MDINKIKETLSNSNQPSSPKKYNNNMKGRLFRNSYKNTDNQPDFRGEVTLEGVEYKISGWSRTSSKGGDYISLSLTSKDSFIKKTDKTNTVEENGGNVEEKSNGVAEYEMLENLPF